MDVGSLGSAIKAGFNLKKSGHGRINGSRLKYIMTIEGLLTHPIEVEVSGFSFGLSTAPWLNPLTPTFQVMSEDFTIHKSSDKWSPLMQQASMTGKAIQASITVVEQVTNRLLKQVTYEFSNALIKSIQSSGTAAEGITETVQFGAERPAVRDHRPPIPEPEVRDHRTS